MRRFHSYGPVNERKHFTVPRKELVRSCADNLIGDPEEGGHYFTIWAPRQTGKTWMIRRVKAALEAQYPDRFDIGLMSMQGVVMEPDEPAEGFLNRLPLLFWETFKMEMGDPPARPDAFKNLFLKEKGLFEKPLILFIDEFDSLPRDVIDYLITLFRDMYLKRESYVLHGLALIGVRAVLGVESGRGSPFNIQRSLHVPNFTFEEVAELFRQYEDESGQAISAEVLRDLFEVTRGQPGLTGWFGELLTETYNPGAGRSIGLSEWEDVYEKALHMEWNNTILNLIKKARGEYAEYVMELFARSDMHFSIRAEWCAYLYLNGIIDGETVVDENRKKRMVCRFSSPFVQHCLFDTFTLDLIGERLPILALSPTDRITDVLKGAEIDLAGLMERYAAYLKRMRAKGLNPWKGQPRRADMHLTEAVGHFHLYAWLREAVGRYCAVSPEFPRGNGRVDLRLECGGKIGIIEVKSFRDLAEFEASLAQAAGYARKLGLTRVMIALFAPVEDEAVLGRLSREVVIDEVRVTVAAIGWG